MHPFLVYSCAALRALQRLKELPFVMHRYVISLHYYYVPKSMDISDPWASSDPWILSIHGHLQIHTFDVF
jgi:hypothetical protein